MNLIYYAVAALGGAVGIVFLRRWIAVRPVPLSDDPVRTQWYEYFRTDARLGRIRDSTTSDLLLAEAKYLVSQKIDSIKNAEAKASAQLSIVGGGLGLLSVFGANQAPIVQGFIGFIGAGFVLLLASIIFNVILIAIGRTDALPNIDVYNSEEVNSQPLFKGRVSVSLTEGYLDYGGDLQALSRQKGRLQKAATVCFVGGVLALALNYGFVAMHPPTPKVPTYRCDISGKSLICKDITP